MSGVPSVIGVVNGPAIGNSGSLSLSAGGNSLKINEKMVWFEKSHSRFLGCSWTLPREGVTLPGDPPGPGGELQAGRTHLAWGFHGKPISRAKSWLCGGNLSEVGFAGRQRLSPELPEPSGST